MEKNTEREIEGITLPSGRVLKRTVNDLGTITTIIPKEAAEEYGRYVVEQYNAVVRQWASEHIKNIRYDY